MMMRMMMVLLLLLVLMHKMGLVMQLAAHVRDAKVVGLRDLPRR